MCEMSIARNKGLISVEKETCGIRPPQAGSLDQSQRWADRNEDGWTGTSSCLWREGRCEARRLLPDGSQRHNHFEYGASGPSDGCRLTPCSCTCTLPTGRSQHFSSAVGRYLIFSSESQSQ